MAFDISSTTPAAPSGRKIITWLSDGSANISGSTELVPWNARGPWSSGTTYAIGDQVSYSGSSYLSLQAGNLNHQPDTSPTFWALLGSSAFLSPLTTKGDIYGRSASADARLPVGANDTFPRADSTQALGIRYDVLVAADIPAIPESRVTSLVSDLAATEKTANKGAASGYAPLDSSSKVPAANLPAQPVMLPVSLVGLPGPGATVFLFTATDAISFLGNFSGSSGTVGTNPTATATYTVKKNGSSIGTLVVSTGGVVTFTTTSGAAQSLAIGDRLTVIAPSSQDATLADAAITLRGTR